MGSVKEAPEDARRQVEVEAANEHNVQDEPNASPIRESRSAFALPDARAVSQKMVAAAITDPARSKRRTSAAQPAGPASRPHRDLLRRLDCGSGPRRRHICAPRVVTVAPRPIRTSAGNIRLAVTSPRDSAPSRPICGRWADPCCCQQRRFERLRGQVQVEPASRLENRLPPCGVHHAVDHGLEFPAIGFSHSGGPPRPASWRARRRSAVREGWGSADRYPVADEMAIARRRFASMWDADSAYPFTPRDLAAQGRGRGFTAAEKAT